MPTTALFMIIYWYREEEKWIKSVPCLNGIRFHSFTVVFNSFRSWGSKMNNNWFSRLPAATNTSKLAFRYYCILHYKILNKQWRKLNFDPECYFRVTNTIFLFCLASVVFDNVLIDLKSLLITSANLVNKLNAGK